jgi:hypothetical protein
VREVNASGTTSTVAGNGTVGYGGARSVVVLDGSGVGVMILRCGFAEGGVIVDHEVAMGGAASGSSGRGAPMLIRRSASVVACVPSITAMIARTISGGTRSAEGTQTCLSLASLFQTWHAHGRNPFLACYSLLHSGLPQL